MGQVSVKIRGICGKINAQTSGSCVYGAVRGLYPPWIHALTFGGACAEMFKTTRIGKKNRIAGYKTSSSGTAVLLVLRVLFLLLSVEHMRQLR
jgi:hypothetical protein